MSCSEVEVIDWQRYFNLATRLARKYGLSQEDALDVAVTVCSKFYTAFLRGALDDVKNVNAYFITMVRHEASTLWRKNQKIEDTVPLSEDLLIADDGDNTIAQEQVQLAREQVEWILEFLNEKDREYLVMRFWDEMTPKEIASDSGCSVGAVYARWFRLSRKIQKLLFGFKGDAQ